MTHMQVHAHTHTCTCTHTHTHLGTHTLAHTIYTYTRRLHTPTPIQTHTLIHTSVCLFTRLLVCLSVCLLACLSVLPARLLFVSLSVDLSVCLPMSHSIYISSFCLSIGLLVSCLSVDICLCGHRRRCLFVCASAAIKIT